MNNLDNKILQQLKESRDGFISGETLCTQLGITRSAVWKHIKNLRENGYEIESVTNRGYKLEKSPNIPFECEVKPFLNTESLGQTLIYYTSLDSTNSTAREHAEDGAPHGTVIVADRQNQGRGRLRRNWYSPANVNLYFSVILRPLIPPVNGPSFSLLAALTLAKVLQKYFQDKSPRIKWPNDVLINGKKVAGILADINAQQDCIDSLILGMGVNVNIPLEDFPEEVRSTATSLKAELGYDVNRPKLLADIINQMETVYTLWLDKGLNPFIEEWQQSSFLMGKHITVSNVREKTSGTVQGLTDTGELLILRDDGKTEAVTAGDTSIEKT